MSNPLSNHVGLVERLLMLVGHKPVATVAHNAKTARPNKQKKV
jgi:hypothetical protein